MDRAVVVGAAPDEHHMVAMYSPKTGCIHILRQFVGRVLVPGTLYHEGTHALQTRLGTIDERPKLELEAHERELELTSRRIKKLETAGLGHSEDAYALKAISRQIVSSINYYRRMLIDDFSIDLQ